MASPQTQTKSSKRCDYYQIATTAVKFGCFVAGYFSFRYLYDQTKRKLNGYPPGPTGVPIFGSALAMMSDFRQFLTKLSSKNKYISMYYIGVTPTIVIHNALVMKQLFGSNQFSTRKQIKLDICKSCVDGNSGELIERRKIICQWLISQTQRSTNLYSLIEKSITLNMFDTIDQCIMQSKKWDIRNEAQYVTYCAIYG